MKLWGCLFWITGILLPTMVQGTAVRFRLMWYEDPATTMVVGFQILHGNPQKHFLYYDTVDHQQDTSGYSNRVAIQHLNQFADMQNAFVRLQGLQPNTAYYFVVADTAGVSRRLWFMTAPDDPLEPLSFVAGGDSRNNRTPRKNANRVVAKLRPHAVLFAGDFTYSGVSIQWRDWLDDWQLTIGTDGRMIPLVPARGNHEPTNEHLSQLFLAPHENYFALTFGGGLIRTYALNTEISIGGQQTNWLAKDLKEQCHTRWKFAFYHKPMRPHVSGKPEGNQQYTHWAPLFYEHQVRMVLESDAHVVKTTWPIRPDVGSESEEGFVLDEKKGTVYIGEGCWGAPLRVADDTKSWTRDDSSFNQVKWIWVYPQYMEARTVIVPEATALDTIPTLADAQRFAVPQGLQIWTPEHGAVVRLERPEAEIRLESPLDNAFLADPATIALEATAINRLGPISSVRFLVNGIPQATDSLPPYHWNWIPPGVGNYVLGAETTLPNGSRLRSCPVRMRIGDPRVSQQVAVGDCQDDAVQRENGQIQVSTVGLDLHAGRQAALRFRNLDVPSGAMIASAILTFELLELGSDGLSLTFQAEAADHAIPFRQQLGDFHLRVRSKAWAAWQLRPGNGSLTGTVDVTNLLQEIIGRNGWQSGNAFCLLIGSEGSGRLHSCETGHPARLAIRYAEPFQEENVRLSTFTVEPWRNTYARIYWHTERENQLSAMILERSRSGDFFWPFRTLGANGGLNWDASYTVIDSVPFYGRSFYRVRMINEQGEQTYSAVQSLLMFPQKQFFVYPNPTTIAEGFTIELDALGDSLAGVQLYDLKGTRVWETTTILIPGRNRSLFRPQALPPGLYLLRVQWAGKPEWQKIWIR